MRKLLMLLAVTGMLSVSCNNKDKKSGGDAGIEKDDYLKGKKTGNADEESNSSGWSASDKGKFNTECQKSMDEAGVDQSITDRVCPCVLEKVSNRYSSYKEAEEGGGESEIEKFAKNCVTELGIGNNNGNNNSNAGTDNSSAWSISDENNFLQECKGSAVQSVGAARATQYCECMLGKLKSMFSSFAEADRQLKNITEDQLTQLASGCN